MAEQGPLSNQKLGEKYLLGDLLGQGGFGVVYQAEHALLHRQQAIKILLEQYLSSPRFRERFIREAQTLAALDHPHIVHVDDFGIEGNRAYLVMPYIGGGTLHSLLRRRAGPLRLDEIGRYLEHICAALYYAHARNVAHLDLKPNNLLLQEDGRLLLSDFGLAHLMGEGAVEGGTSLQFGTPAYMAPEHLRGQRDRRSDVYSLGVILYQMLTGRAPFEGSTPAAIMLKQLTEAPPPLREGRPDLPAPLGDVLAKALEKQPEERYQTPGELFLDFKAALGGRLPQPLAWQFTPPAAPTLPEPKKPLQPMPEVLRPPAAGKRPLPPLPEAPHPVHITPVPIPAPPGPAPAPEDAPLGSAAKAAYAAWEETGAEGRPQTSLGTAEETLPALSGAPQRPPSQPLPVAPGQAQMTADPARLTRPLPETPQVAAAQVDDESSAPTLADPIPRHLSQAALGRAVRRSAPQAPTTLPLDLPADSLASAPIWTRGFTGLFVVAAMLSGFAILGAFIAFPHYFDTAAAFTNYYSSAAQAQPGVYLALVVQGLVAVACLVALIFTRSSLLYAGLLLQVGAAASRIAQAALFLGLGASLARLPSESNLQVLLYFGLFSSLLNLVSLICLAYAMAPWRTAWDVGTGVPVVLLSIGLAFLAVWSGVSGYSALTQVWLGIILACHLLACLALLGRPACWRRYPLVTAFFVLAGAPFALLSPGVLPAYVLYDFFPVPFLFLILGVLLLLHVQRARFSA